MRPPRKLSTRKAGSPILSSLRLLATALTILFASLTISYGTALADGPRGGEPDYLRRDFCSIVECESGIQAEAPDCKPTVNLSDDCLPAPEQSVFVATAASALDAVQDAAMGVAPADCVAPNGGNVCSAGATAASDGVTLAMSPPSPVDAGSAASSADASAPPSVSPPQVASPLVPTSTTPVSSASDAAGGPAAGATDAAAATNAASVSSLLSSDGPSTTSTSASSKDDLSRVPAATPGNVGIESEPAVEENGSSSSGLGKQGPVKSGMSSPSLSTPGTSSGPSPTLASTSASSLSGFVPRSSTTLAAPPVAVDKASAGAVGKTASVSAVEMTSDPGASATGVTLVMPVQGNSCSGGVFVDSQTGRALGGSPGC